jgi:nickel/cobalt transporter (NicO) family protein
VLLLISALSLGFLHGLGADHLMGIAALSLSPTAGGPAAQRARALGIAVRFAVGHAVLLGAGAAALIVLGWSLPLAVERGGEMLGGVLLIALGAMALWGAAAGRLYGHTHVHSSEPAPHWHLHFGSPDHHPASAAHSHVPTIIGAAFAISSLRALTLLAPFGASVERASLGSMLGLVAIFAIGILISMSLFGVAFARLMSARAILRLGRASAVLMAFASIALGGYWIFAAI